MTATKYLTRRPHAFITAAIALVLGVSSQAGASEEVVIASTGGAYDKALREAWFDPFTKETGITVKTVAATNAEMRAKATAMVKTGNVSWDLYMQGEIQAMSPQHLETAEDIGTSAGTSTGVKTSLWMPADQVGSDCSPLQHCLSMIAATRPRQFPRPGRTCGTRSGFQAAGPFPILTTPGG